MIPGPQRHDLWPETAATERRRLILQLAAANAGRAAHGLGHSPRSGPGARRNGGGRRGRDSSPRRRNREIPHGRPRPTSPTSTSCHWPAWTPLWALPRAGRPVIAPTAVFRGLVDQVARDKAAPRRPRCAGGCLRGRGELASPGSASSSGQLRRPRDQTRPRRLS